MTEVLTNEKFQEIYSDEKFRNGVAFAHRFCDSSGKALGLKTCSYPIDYIVSEDQIALARTERQRAKAETISNLRNTLAFVGMGMDYNERYPDDVCNHRIRTELQNSRGVKYFIEFSSGRGDSMHVCDAINRDKEAEVRASGVDRQSEYYLYFGQNGSGQSFQYTKQNVLNFVNRELDCQFTKIVIDNYNLSTEDYTSISPQRIQETA